MQEWPDMMPGHQWGEPWLTVVVKSSGSIEDTAAVVKAAHNGLRTWHLDGKWTHIPQPYSVILWIPEPDPELEAWAEPRRLRQHHGDTTIVDGQIVRRNAATEPTWAGDFRVWRGPDPAGAIREGAHCWAVVEDLAGLGRLLAHWEGRQAKETTNTPPAEKREQIRW